MSCLIQDLLLFFHLPSYSLLFPTLCFSLLYFSCLTTCNFLNLLMSLLLYIFLHLFAHILRPLCILESFLFHILLFHRILVVLSLPVALLVLVLFQSILLLDLGLTYSLMPRMNYCL